MTSERADALRGVPHGADATRGAVAGLVLAGGRSRRFGSDKARHRVEGRPMVEHVAAALAGVAGEVLVSVRPGDEEGWPGRPVVDQYPGAGPLAGLQAGLHATPNSWLLVVACDMPFVTPRALQQLVAAIAPEVRAVVSEDANGRLQPLCACYHRSLEPVARSMLESDQQAVHRFVDRVEGLRRVCLPPAVLRNVNRPTDLE